MRNDSVDSKPQDMDWVEALGEDMEGYQSYEAVECPECEHTYVACGHYGICPECDTEHAELGPMMNYFYPVELQDCSDAAEKIIHLPLCVVEFQDGTTGMALTGGGMDFSWEICDAYVSLGYLPPVHFCRLPEMAGWEKDTRSKHILEACLESAEVAARWAECKAGQCREMLTIIQATEANEKAAQ